MTGVHHEDSSQLTLIRSHAIERLFDRLAASLDRPRADPLDLQADHVVVPSLAIGRWLRERLARRNGVAMQIETPYLAQFVLSLAMKAMPELSSQSPFDATSLAWRLMRLFDRIEGSDRELAPLHAFLTRTRRDHDANARMQLAERLAQQFDRMTAYRSEWLAHWAAGKRVLDAGVHDLERWQAQLFRLVLADLGADRGRASLERFAQHPVDAFAQRLRDDDVLVSNLLPDRIDLFAVPAIPPLYWRALMAIARHRPVVVHELVPTPVYMADLSTPRGVALARIDNPAAAELLDVGHPLLALWGRQAADLQAQSTLDDLGQGLEDFDVEAEPGLLASLQSSIVDCRMPDDGEWSGLVADDSIVVIAATSIERQLEVIHDELLRRFDADASLRPSDVAVLLPDIDAAAPAIEAVFGGAPRERSIDWRLSGRRETADRDGLAAALLMLIDLVESRAPFSRVTALLRHPACRRRFAIDAADGDDLIDRLRETGARWGWDVAHRRTFGLDMSAHHSWLDAIDRLVLGYAHGAPDDPTVLDGIAGSLLEPASATLAALSTIQSLRVDWERPRSVREWSRSFERAFDAMFEVDAIEADDAARVRAACAQLAIDAKAGGSDGLIIDRRLARRQLEVALEGRAPGAMTTGAVTFAGIGPMRAVPFRVIVLAGLDNQAWPRPTSNDEFNLMALRRQPGDPSRRSEDRGALLDTVMAARDAVIVTYTGRDPRDGSTLAPALVVEELLDVLRKGGGASAVKQAITRKAALHGFSPDAFAASRPSFSAEWLPAAEILAGGASPPATPFFVPRKVDLEAWRERIPRRLSIDDLVSFLSNPPAFFMRRGLRYSDFNKVDDAADEEPLVAPTEKELVCMVSRVGEARWRGRPIDEIREAERMFLPHGMAGQFVFDKAFAESTQWLEFMTEASDALGVEVEPLMVDIAIDSALGPLSLVGQVARRERGLLVIEPREFDARARARVFVRWLVQAAAGAAGDDIAVSICGDSRRILVDRNGWDGDAVETLSRLVVDAAASTVSPLAMSAEAGWQYVGKPDARSWLTTWGKEFAKPWRHLGRLFPDSREHPPASVGLAGPRDFTEWALRLYGPMKAVSTTNNRTITSRLAQRSAPPRRARKPRALKVAK